MFKFEIREDTFTPWADRKLQESELFLNNLMTFLANTFLEETDPFVPVVSGSLLKSAHYMWHWSGGFPAVGLDIVWTGIFNPHQEEFDVFRNTYREDYAWSVYHGEHYKPTSNPASSDHWVEQSLTYFDAPEVESILEEKFLEWLFEA